MSSIAGQGDEIAAGRSKGDCPTGTVTVGTARAHRRRDRRRLRRRDNAPALTFDLVIPPPHRGRWPAGPEGEGPSRGARRFQIMGFTNHLWGLRPPPRLTGHL